MDILDSFGLALEDTRILSRHLNARVLSGKTAFMCACWRGRIDVVQLLLGCSKGQIDLNARDMHGYTGLMLACLDGHQDVVKLILKHSKAKGIKIPTNTSIYSKEIKDLIENHHKMKKIKRV